MTVFRDRVCKEVIKLRSLVGSQSNMIGVFIQRDQNTDTHRGKTMWRHREKMAICLLRREA